MFMFIVSATRKGQLEDHKIFQNVSDIIISDNIDF